MHGNILSIGCVVQRDLEADAPLFKIRLQVSAESSTCVALRAQRKALYIHMLKLEMTGISDCTIDLRAHEMMHVPSDLHATKLVRIDVYAPIYTDIAVCAPRHGSFPTPL